MSGLITILIFILSAIGLLLVNCRSVLNSSSIYLLTCKIRKKNYKFLNCILNKILVCPKSYTPKVFFFKKKVYSVTDI